MNQHREHQSSNAPALPFSRPIKVHDVPREGLSLTIAATGPERLAIAEDLGLPGIGALSAKISIVPRAGDRFDVSGMLEARITQLCVVTLDTFESVVAKPIALTFASVVEIPEVRPKRREREAMIVTARPAAAVPGRDDQEDPPDPVVDGKIDLGAVVLEFLVLACDIHPRRPGVDFTDMVVDQTIEPEPSAFAALKRLKDRS